MPSASRSPESGWEASMSSFGLSASVPALSSVPSSIPPPSVSMLSGFRPRASSSPSSRPSPSVSRFTGSVPRSYHSSPSDRPSPSLSQLLGFEPVVSTSSPSPRPSPSVSGLSGSAPTRISQPSAMPSSSVSASFGSVPWASSTPSSIRSPSVSGLRGSSCQITSSRSLTPSPSVSGLTGLVPRSSSVRLSRPSPSSSARAPMTGRVTTLDLSTLPAPTLTAWILISLTGASPGTTRVTMATPSASATAMGSGMTGPSMSRQSPCKKDGHAGRFASLEAMATMTSPPGATPLMVRVAVSDRITAVAVMASAATGAGACASVGTDQSGVAAATSPFWRSASGEHARTSARGSKKVCRRLLDRCIGLQGAEV